MRIDSKRAFVGVLQALPGAAIDAIGAALETALTLMTVCCHRRCDLSVRYCRKTLFHTESGRIGPRGVAIVIDTWRYCGR
jgi:hypothetical protein